MLPDINGHNPFTIILITGLISLILVPIVKKIALHVNALDQPNKRRINRIAIPTQGSLAILIAFTVGCMLYTNPNYQINAILIGSFLLIIMGLIDGINPLKARYQLITQLVVAAIVVFYGRIYLTDISFLGLAFVIPNPWNYCATILFIVGIMNAMNLIDGLDGLCGGIAIIYFGTIAIIAFLLNKLGGLDIILTLLMFGSTIGFLIHNFPPASIYLGNGGSNFLGYMIAVIALFGFKVATLTSLIIPLFILAIPIFDTALAIFRRLLKGQSIVAADKEHFHHQLLKMKFSPRITVIIIYVINLLFAVVSVLYVIGNRQSAIFIYLLLMVILLFLVLKTDILFQHNSSKKSFRKGTRHGQN